MLWNAINQTNQFEIISVSFGTINFDTPLLLSHIKQCIKPLL